MEDKTKLLIAVGAAVAVNCQPCFKTIARQAREAGVGEKEILEAVGVARLVRNKSHMQMDRFVAGITGAEAAAGDSNGGCGCT